MHGYRRRLDLVSWPWLRTWLRTECLRSNSDQCIKMSWRQPRCIVVWERVLNTLVVVVRRYEAQENIENKAHQVWYLVAINACDWWSNWPHSNSIISRFCRIVWKLLTFERHNVLEAFLVPKTFFYNIPSTRCFSVLERRGGISELSILYTPHGAGGEVKSINMYFSSRTRHGAGGVGEWKWMKLMNIPPPWLSLSQLSLQHWPGLFATACSDSKGLGQVPLLHSPQLCELDCRSVWVTCKDSAHIWQSMCPLGPYFLSYYL